MKRKGFWIGFSYLLGLFFAAYCSGEYQWVFAAAVIGIGAVIFGCMKKYRLYTVCCCVGILAGIGVSALYTELVYNKLTAFDGEIVTAVGYVQDYEYIGSDTCTLTVKGKINGVSGKVTFYVPDADWDYYDRVSVTGKVYKITDSINFCTKDYMKSKGVFIRGATAEKAEETGGNANPIMREIKKYRDYLSAKISLKCPEREGAFLKAMLFGDKSELSQSMKTTAYRSGVGHIFAVSGTHLVIVTEMFALLIKGIKRKRLRYGLTLAVIWGFAAFSGLSPSVVRAAVMMTAVKSGYIFGRKSDCGNSLGICAVILTAGCPYTAANPSFLMSMAAAYAMGGIAPKLCGYVKNTGLVGKAEKYAVTMLTLLFMTLPLNILLFDGVSVIAPISNIVVIPLCSIALGVAFLLVLSGGFGYAVILKISGKLIGIAVNLSEKFSEIPYCYIPSKYKALNVFMLLGCLLPIFIIVKSKSVKKGGAAGLALIFTWLAGLNICRFFEPEAELAVLADGKKSEYVLRTGESCVIFQCGTMIENGGAERYIRYSGAEEISCIFCPSNYDEATVDDDFPFIPEHTFIEAGIGGNLFEVGDSMEFEDFTVRQTEKGYIVLYGDTELYLQNNGFYINGVRIDTAKEKYPIIVDMEKSEARRVGYGFN